MGILSVAFELVFYPGILSIVMLSLIYSGIIRKTAAWMQNRIGPPIVQPIYDIIKLFGKRNITSSSAKIGFDIWPSIALASAVLSGLIVPLFATGILMFKGDLIFVIYLLVLSSLSCYLAGFSSGNPFAIQGGIRGITLMFAYELVFAVSVVVYIAANHSSNIIYSTSWLAVSYPFGAAAFFLVILAKSELPPFHIPGAHQEIVSGSFVEYTGPRLAVLELSHFVKMFVLIALGITLYLGGAATITAFLYKSVIVLMLVVLSRVIMARLKIDTSLKFLWIFGLIAIVDIFRALWLI